MAGKFMSPEEAARLLGISVDEVNRLVDRKQLFPMRDGATNKFKTDDVERLLRTLGEESGSGSGELDLDLPELVLDNVPAGGPGEATDDDQLILDDGADSIFATPTAKGPSASDTGVGKGSVASKSNSGLSLSSPGLSGADLVLTDSVLGDDLESDDLAIESIVGASSPSLGGSGISKASGSGDLMIELSGISSASSAASKSDSGIAGLSGPGLSGPGLSGPGLGGLSGGLGSGVSLGDSSLADSGVDLGSAASAAKGAFSGDDFELGGEATDDESASVVIASDSEAGDSSFFGQTIGGQSSSFGGDDSSLGSAGSAGSAETLAFPTQMLDEMSFSAWQIVGLVCCSLLLLFGGFIAYDLVRTIGSPESTTLSNPLLNSLAEIFGWR
ncbi:MAG: helix-turn-helix domain-containing protein [Planctomycetota bacterium]|nr:helix-turn-helix domain-containing protein [Planctomycetota bacterium]